MLFQNLKGGVKPGAKVAIVGKNGAGKSTLLNMIEQRAEGITVAKPVKLGFFHQRLENLDPAKSILENHNFSMTQVSHSGSGGCGTIYVATR